MNTPSILRLSSIESLQNQMLSLEEHHRDMIRIINGYTLFLETEPDSSHLMAAHKTYANNTKTLIQIFHNMLDITRVPNKKRTPYLKQLNEAAQKLSARYRTLVNTALQKEQNNDIAALHARLRQAREIFASIGKTCRQNMQNPTENPQRVLETFKKTIQDLQTYLRDHRFFTLTSFDTLPALLPAAKIQSQRIHSTMKTLAFLQTCLQKMQ